MDMFGFDGCCCGCIQWQQNFSAKPDLDNWTVESGDWSFGLLGLTATGADCSLLCKRTCWDDVAYVDLYPVVTYGGFDYSNGFTLALDVGGWKSKWPGPYLLDAAGTVRSNAVLTPSLFYGFNCLRIYADGEGASNGLGYVQGSPDDNAIRIRVTNPNGTTFSIGKVLLYRKQKSGSLCIGHPDSITFMQPQLSLAYDRMTPLRFQVGISGLARGSEGFPNTQLNGTYLVGNLTSNVYTPGPGSYTFDPHWDSDNFTVTIGDWYGGSYVCNTGVWLAQDGTLTCKLGIRTAGGTTMAVIAWSATADTAVDGLLGISGLELSNPTITYGYPNPESIVPSQIVIAGSSCHLTAIP